MAEEGIAAGGVMDVNTALQEVLKTALIHDGLARGIREAAKALDKYVYQSQYCGLLQPEQNFSRGKKARSSWSVDFLKLQCLNDDLNVGYPFTPFMGENITVDDNKKLGEWVGLCKIDREGKPRKVVGCSCVVVKDYGKESQAKDVIEEYFKCKK
ncbi:ribosomal protein S12 [Ictidomys tridecemlineatus]|nr:ribosomal protein S12 [Ictidomys tridecemlineatus]